MLKTTLLSLAAAITLLATSTHQLADAADFGPAAASPMASARALIAQKKWAAAIEQLKAVNRPDDADWNNLMGYSLRKAKVPDYAAAERHYDAALRLDPHHRGALEYSGELYVMTGDLPRARQRLAALEAECPSGCAERGALADAIAAREAESH